MGTEFEMPSGAKISLPAPLNAQPYLTGVGSEGFVERTKEQIGIRAKGREVRGMEDQFELREPEVTYHSHFEAKKADIGPENTYLWNDYPWILDS
jgi:hypothetical protein